MMQILIRILYPLQNIMNVDESCTSLQQILSENFLNQYDSEKLEYWLILENAAYINTLVDMTFHLIIAVLCFIVYLVLIFIMYLIYLIFYPIRRRIQKENRRYHNGEVNHPYRKKDFRSMRRWYSFYYNCSNDILFFRKLNLCGFWRKSISK